MITRQAATRQLAYQLWQERGSPTESPETDWFAAEHLMVSGQSARRGVRGKLAAPPGFLRQPFMGYLSPLLEGYLLDLVNTSRTYHPQHAPENHASLKEFRYTTLQTLFMLWQDSSHAEAERIVTQAAAAGTPFCLYLRNFDLGARASASAMYDEIGNPLIFTLFNNSDRAMQDLLQRVVGPVMPVVGIQNQSGELGKIPRFCVGDEDWESLASTLVRRASLIVFYFLELTPGVQDEIDLIRAAARQTRTLIAFAKKNDIGMGLLFGVERVHVGELSGAALAAKLPDFSLHAPMEDSQNTTEAEAGLASLLKDPVVPVCEPLGAFPPESMPPPDAIAYASIMAHKEYGDAVTFMEQGKYEDAEDSLIRSICLCFWCRDTVGRMLGMLTLAGLLHRRLNLPGPAQTVYDLAIPLCESLLPTSPMAREYYPRVLEAAAELKAAAANSQ